MATVWKRKDRNVWVADCRDAAGRRVRMTARTRAEAEEILAEKIKESRQAAPPVAERDIPLARCAAKWLDTVKHELEPKTVQSYRHLLNRHIVPALGHLKVREIHRGHLKSLLSEKRQRGYSKNTVRLIRAAISSLLTDAVDEGLIQSNPAHALQGTKKSRPDRITQGEHQQRIRPMAREQLHTLLSESKKEPRYTTLFAILAKAGLRPGEALALQPGDLDLQTRTVSVERALSAGRIKSTKTQETRTVDLSGGLVEMLERHLAWLKKEALRRGWKELRWLFPNQNGDPLDQSKVGKEFRQTLKRARLPSFRLYDLRHTYASQLLASGAPITYVAAQLGHAKPTTTLYHYAKWIPSEGQHFVDALDAPPAEVGTKTWHQRPSNKYGSE